MLWVAKGTSATVVISVESAMEVMAAWKVMKDIMAAIVDLQVMVATTVDTVLVMVVKARWITMWGNQGGGDGGHAAGYNGYKEGENFGSGTMVLVGTIKVLKIIVDNSYQVMDQ